MDGVINVLKPPGMTSHDVISFLRRTLHQRRIGHAGTLDPQAAGVLPVCVGQATRLVEYLGAADKEYLCELTLGLTTTTQDAWGEVTARREALQVLREEVEDILPAYTGSICQQTPMYSAVKVEGEPLYKKARRGETVQPLSRQVIIYDLRLIEFVPPRAKLLIRCSRGTYIRTLCHDIGQQLGVGGHMSFLLRTRVGGFNLRESLTLEAIAEQGEKALLPVGLCVEGLYRFNLADREIARIKSGQSIIVPGKPDSPKEVGVAGEVAVFDREGALQAIGRLEEVQGNIVLRPRKVLHTET